MKGITCPLRCVVVILALTIVGGVLLCLPSTASAIKGPQFACSTDEVMVQPGVVFVPTGTVATITNGDVEFRCLTLESRTK